MWRQYVIQKGPHKPETLHGVEPRSIRINQIQQDAADAGIYLLQNYSTCFGCLYDPSSGVHQTVTAASGTGHTV